MFFTVIIVTVLALFALILLIKMTNGVAKSYVCLVGKTALVTGGNSGIGYVVCMMLAARGCRLIIADKDDSEQSRKRIIQTTGNPHVFCEHIDLTSFKSIRAFSERFHRTYDRLDILVNNAGVASLPLAATEDGLHPAHQVNYFGGFLLSHLLVDLLKKSAPSRIVNTSSFMAYLGQVDVAKFGEPTPLESTLDSYRVYCDNKLAVLMGADRLAERLQGTGVTVNTVHPGLVHTGIVHKALNVRVLNGVFHYQIISVLYYLTELFFGKNVWEGAQTTFHAATDESLESVSGEFFADCVCWPKPIQARNKVNAEKLFRRTEERVKLTQDEKIPL